MNKQLIWEAMCQDLFGDHVTPVSDDERFNKALDNLNNAGFVVVPKEPTEAMINASGCECGMGEPEVYGDPNELYITNDYKAMIQAAQQEPEE